MDILLRNLLSFRKAHKSKSFQVDRSAKAHFLMDVYFSADWIEMSVKANLHYFIESWGEKKPSLRHISCWHLVLHCIPAKWLSGST